MDCAGELSIDLLTMQNVGKSGWVTGRFVLMRLRDPATIDSIRTRRVRLSGSLSDSFRPRVCVLMLMLVERRCLKRRVEISKVYWLR